MLASVLSTACPVVYLHLRSQKRQLSKKMPRNNDISTNWHFNFEIALQSDWP